MLPTNISHISETFDQSQRINSPFSTTKTTKTMASINDVVVDLRESQSSLSLVHQKQYSSSTSTNSVTLPLRIHQRGLSSQGSTMASSSCSNFNDFFNLENSINPFFEFPASKSPLPDTNFKLVPSEPFSTSYKDLPSTRITLPSHHHPSDTANSYCSEYSRQEDVEKKQHFSTPSHAPTRMIGSSMKNYSLSILRHDMIQFFSFILKFATYLWSIYLKTIKFSSEDKRSPFLSTLSSHLSHKSTIILYGSVMVEIENCTAHSEKFGRVNYQIYRRHDLTQNDIKADILYLPDAPLTGALVIPPLIATFIHTGHRVILPNLDKYKECNSERTDPSFDVGQQTCLVALVLQSVSFKDQKLDKDENSEPLVPPVFLLGLGHNALVALSYPIEIGQSSIFSEPNGSFGHLSIVSGSRAEPIQSSLMQNIRTAFGSTTSVFTGFGSWTKSSKSGAARAESQVLDSFNSLPEIHGIIAIGPTLDPKILEAKKNGAFKRGLKRVAKKVRAVHYTPNISNAIDKLHQNAFKIKVPVLIAHGTKEAYGLAEGAHALYGALASTESALVYCPTLGNNGNLTGDLNRNGLANECVMWVWERIRSKDLKAGGQLDINDTSSSRSSLTTELFSWDGSSGGFEEDLTDDINHNESRRSGQIKKDSSDLFWVLPNFLESLFSPSTINFEENLELEEKKSSFNLSSPHHDHLDSASSIPLPGTLINGFPGFLPTSLNIKHHPGPRYVVSVAASSSRASVHSLCCVEIPDEGGALEGSNSPVTSDSYWDGDS